MAAFRYWRIYCTATTQTQRCAIAEISMAASVGGANQISGGAAAASGITSGYPASNACDGNTGTYWLNDYAANPVNSTPAWWSYSFPSAVSVIEVKLTAANDSNYNAAPLAWCLQSSSDGTTWTTQSVIFVASVWTVGQTQTFDSNFEATSKITSYGALSPAGQQISKLTAYAPLALQQQEVSKITAYAELSSTAQQVSKITAYAVLAPYVAPDIPTYGPIPIFPSLPYGYPVNVEIEMDTTLGTTKSLREMRAPQQQYPLWNIEIPLYELLDQTQNQIAYAPFTGYQQYQNLVQLWLMMYGQTGVFGFDCPWDDSRANQYLGFGDGTTYIFQLYRTWGIGATATTAPVGLVNTVSQVSVGGTVISPTQYFAARDKLYFQDSSGNTYPPGLGQNVLITFSYYYLCRFVEDEQDFEEFAKNRWTVPSLKFQAVLWI